MRGFNRRDIVRLLDYADLRLFAVRIAAIETQLAVADVVARCADAELVFDVKNRLREIFGVFPWGAEQMKCNALRGFLANARQPLAFLYEPGQRLGKLRHLEQAGRQTHAAEHSAHFALGLFIHFLRGFIESGHGHVL